MLSNRRKWLAAVTLSVTVTTGWSQVIRLRLKVAGQSVSYHYSLDDGKMFQQLGPSTPINFSWWKGSRPALFAYATASTPAGYVDFDGARYLPVGQNPW